MFTKFINENVNLNKADESMLITAIVAPPAAMMDKKAGQVVPQLALMNAIPDVVFVPSATLLALIAIKIIKLTFIGNTTSKDTKTHVQPTPEQKLPTTIAFEKEPQIATKQEPQTTTTIEEPRIATEQEPQTTTAPAIEEEPQTTALAATPVEEEPQTTTAPSYIPRHVHKDNIICPLCNKYH